MSNQLSDSRSSQSSVVCPPSSDPAPRISVIMPAYNVADTIEQALDSVVDQTFKDLEIIVVDDCSADDTVEVVKRWIGSQGQACHRIVELKENKGPSGARNAGIRDARGQWIAFLDADDAWLPWHLEDALRVFSLFSEAVLTTAQVCFDWDQIIECEDISANICQEVVMADFVNGNPVGTSTVVVKKHALNKLGGFDEQFRGPEDMDCWMRVATIGRIMKYNSMVARYRERVGSLSLDAVKFLPEVLRVYEKAFGEGGALHEYRQLHRKAIATQQVSAAWMCLMANERLRGVKLVVQSWITWPGGLGVRKNNPYWRLSLLLKILSGRRS